MEGTWRKSSYSDDGEGNCVEVAWTVNGRHPLARDSKNPDGNVLEFSEESWGRFLSGLTSSKP